MFLDMLKSKAKLLAAWLFLAEIVSAAAGEGIETAAVMFIEVELNNHTYWLSPFKGDYNQARQSCSSRQQVLALFDSRADYSSSSQVLTEELRMRREAPRDIYDVWISLKSVRRDDGTFARSWGNGDVIVEWDASEPNEGCLNTSSVCCARMVWEPSYTAYHQLRDSPCNKSHYFLCMRTTQSSTQSVDLMTSENLDRRPCQSGHMLGAVNKTCDDIDECHNSTPPCSHLCLNTIGSYVCSCRTGYQLLADATTCGDIDECNKFSRMCHQACVNTIGSFKCSCWDGYKLDHHNQTCMDIDECHVKAGPMCSQVCNNTPGSYRCDCHIGYYLDSDNIMCLDIDECVSRPCQYQCSSTVGSYYCTCPTGHTLSTNGNTCLDIDECVSSQCQYQCNNTVGSYYCTCPTGHTLSTNGTTCLDIDECQGTNQCQGACTNMPGSYLCGCHHGYQDINKHCMDVDECVVGHHNCSQTCHNFDGGYNCSCHQGYTTPDDNSFQCHDINECHNDSTCQHTCVNTDGSYYCTCNKGYDLDPNNRSCHDIDECQLNTTLCGHFCNNTPGSFYCWCAPGFILAPDGHSCGRKSAIKQCPCSCVSANNSNSTQLSSVQQRVDELVRWLHINTSTLSSLTRRRSSAEDRRVSSQTVGSFGVVTVVFVLMLLVLQDCVMAVKSVMSIIVDKLNYNV